MSVPEPTVAKPSAKSKVSLINIVLMILMVVILAMLGVVTWLLLKNRRPEPSPATAKIETPAVAATYLPLDPPFIVNFQEQDGLHLLEVGISLMAHDQASLDAAKTANTVIRNDLLLMLSDQNFDTLSGEQGKLDLQKQALAIVRKAAPAPAGHKGIEAVYFTSFVMQ